MAAAGTCPYNLQITVIPWTDVISSREDLVLLLSHKSIYVELYTSPEEKPLRFGSVVESALIACSRRHIFVLAKFDTMLSLAYMCILYAYICRLVNPFQA